MLLNCYKTMMTSKGFAAAVRVAGADFVSDTRINSTKSFLALPNTMILCSTNVCVVSIIAE